MNKHSRIDTNRCDFRVNFNRCFRWWRLLYLFHDETSRHQGREEAERVGWLVGSYSWCLRQERERESLWIGRMKESRQATGKKMKEKRWQTFTSKGDGGSEKVDSTSERPTTAASALNPAARCLAWLKARDGCNVERRGEVRSQRCDCARLTFHPNFKLEASSHLTRLALALCHLTWLCHFFCLLFLFFFSLPFLTTGESGEMSYLFEFFVSLSRLATVWHWIHCMVVLSHLSLSFSECFLLISVRLYLWHEKNERGGGRWREEGRKRGRERGAWA